MRQLSNHHVEEDSFDVGVVCTSLKLSKFGEELVFHCLASKSFDAPQLRLGHAGNPREVEDTALAESLAGCILLNQLQCVHMEVICRVKDLVNHRLHHEPDVCQVGVVLEHVDSCLHSTLHG